MVDKTQSMVLQESTDAPMALHRRKEGEILRDAGIFFGVAVSEFDPDCSTVQYVRINPGFGGTFLPK